MLLAAAWSSQQLQAVIREREGMAYSVGARLSLARDGEESLYQLSLGTRPENLERARTLVPEVLALALEPPSEDELATLVAGIEGRHLMRRITSIGQAYGYAMDIFRARKPGSWVALMEALSEVQPEELGAASAELLSAPLDATAWVE